MKKRYRDGACNGWCDSVAMKLYYEWAQRQLRKQDEELCGDSISVSLKSDSLSMTLSDGLGSGVKANILATLTTEIVMRMLAGGLALSEVVHTLTETLPVCDVRKLAYSTFAIAQFDGGGAARIAEFDSPAVIVVRGRKILPVVFDERSIDGKTIQETVLQLENGDWVVFVSDGVLNAGIGGVYPLGWGWDQAARFVAEKSHADLTADQLAERIADAVNQLYAGRIGDDVSVVVLKVRHKRTATVLTGPPERRETDGELVKRFAGEKGKRIVCGGTTAKIVAKHLGQPLEVDLATITEDVPPTGKIDGVNLVTEGILTLTRVNEMLAAGMRKEDIKFQIDGAANLLRIMLNEDHVHFIVGTAINPAHQNPDLPHQLGIRLSVVREIADELKKRGKEVTVETV